MKIGNATVVTPFLELGDNVMSASGNWAHLVARSLNDNNVNPKSLPAVVRSSPEYPTIIKHVEFLSTPETALPTKNDKTLLLHKIASAWAEKPDGPRAYIDAMLLGGSPYKSIAERIDDGRSNKKLMVELVKLYEVLFMHCRNAAGELLPKPRLHAIALDGRLHVAPADPRYVHWRVKAAMYGIEVVEPTWGEKPADFEDYIDTRWQSIRMNTTDEIDDRTRVGAETTEDLIAVGALGENMMKRKSEERMNAEKATVGESQYADVLQKVIEKFAPRRVDVEEYNGNQKEKVAADKRSLASAKKISKTAVADRGPAGAHAAMDTAVKKQVAHHAGDKPGNKAKKQEKPAK